ncbi:hypothetical protein Tco_0103517 [Tanacetum coccineum]
MGPALMTVTSVARWLMYLLLLRSVCGIEHDQLFTEFNVGAARQMSLSAEVREKEIENHKAQLLLKEAEAAEAIRLRAEASNLRAVEKSLRDETNALKERTIILEKEWNALDVKVTELEASAADKGRELTDLNALVTSVKSQNDILVDRVHELEMSSSGLQEKVTLYTDFVEMALHLEEKFYPRLLTTISGRRWLLTQDMELAIIKCLNSPAYLFALGAAIGKAIEKGMQEGLSAGITHGKEGKVYNQDVLHTTFCRRLINISALNSSKIVISLACRIEIQYRNASLKRDEHPPVEGPLAYSFSDGIDLNSNRRYLQMLCITTVILRRPYRHNFASASIIALIIVDDYEVIGADDQAVADGNDASFPNVDDAELNIVQ